ncbi:MAG: hypothetical protein AB7F86_08245 [Bdellovibrionales bacterium]
MRTIFVLLTFLSSPAWAGGELPFPYFGENQATVIGNHHFLVEGLPLSIEVKVYQDNSNAENIWAKTWIRGDGGYVWDRIWTQVRDGVLRDVFEVGDRRGRLEIHLNRLDQTHLIFDGRSYPIQVVQ